MGAIARNEIALARTGLTKGLDENVRLSAPVWQSSLPDSPRLGQDLTHADIVVVGAGLTGLSAAYHLLKRFPGREVVVLDAAGVGGGASARSTGMLTPGIGQNLGGLALRFGREVTREMYNTSLDAVRHVARIVEEEGIECDLHLSGQLVVAKGKDGRKRIASQARVFSSLDLPCSVLSDEQLSERVQFRQSAPGTGPAALYLPTAGVLHPGKLLSGLAEAIHRRGGRIFSNAKVANFGRGTPVEVHFAERAPLRANHVVLATNGYSAEVEQHHGRVLPLHLRLIATAPLTPANHRAIGWQGREAIIDSRRLFNYFRMTDDGRIIFGGGLPKYYWGGGLTEREPGAAGLELRNALLEQFNFDTPPEVTGSWTGVIGYVLDGLPTVSRLKHNPRMVSAAGWCGHGIALGFLSGEWLARLVGGEDPDRRIPWFRRGAPLLPTEFARWMGVSSVTRLMRAMD